MTVYPRGRESQKRKSIVTDQQIQKAQIQKSIAFLLYERGTTWGFWILKQVFC